MATIRSHASAWKGRSVDLRLLDVSEITDLYASANNQDRLANNIRERSYQLANRDHWTGDVTRKELEAMLAQGWPEGATRAVAMGTDLKALAPQAKAIKRRKVWSDQGDDIDMQKVYAGDLDTAWSKTTHRTDAGPQVVTIACQYNHSFHVDSSDLFWTGAAALALTDILEDAGYRVELLAVTAGESYITGNLAVGIVTIKAADMPLSVDSVASVLCHPGTYRVYGLPLTFVCRDRIDNAVTRSGWIQNASEVMPALLEAGLVGGADVCIDQVYDRQAAIRCITEALKRLQGE